MHFGKYLWRIVASSAAILIVASAAATMIFFPWSTDPQADESSSSAVKSFYQKAYTEISPGAETDGAAPLPAKEQFYVDNARTEAVTHGIPAEVDRFVATANLKDKKVLEVGAGSGLLQDAVADYTGLDISATARRFFHKPFVQASATDMPFPDNTFDGMWTIWVLEHIPNPEKALMEMRR